MTGRIGNVLPAGSRDRRDRRHRRDRGVETVAVTNLGLRTSHQAERAHGRRRALGGHPDRPRVLATSR
ncbi:hypothetical protein FRAAL0488 [Frankia alni ACN14a]|uniref:Uncharacterized protein n=1 Tax=Frankia alni (strain DSM 45986 / CECT 9034 / ACN14a) TaxID=326424 RepID=Q0RTD8_FRAAA|nr:hypothetical protein FRAAL0488 [Frankia alni ACN14a]